MVRCKATKRGPLSKAALPQVVLLGWRGDPKDSDMKGPLINQNASWDGLLPPWWLSTLSQRIQAKRRNSKIEIYCPIIPPENQLCRTKCTSKLARSNLVLTSLSQAFERLAITTRPLRISGQASEWQKEKVFKLSHHIKLHWSSWGARSCQFYTVHGQTSDATGLDRFQKLP